MTTYRSEADFDERFGRDIEPDGRFSIVSYLDHQGEKLVERFDAATYRILAGAMDRHDIGLAWGGIDGAFTRLAAAGTAVTGIGIEDDILYGPRQVKVLVDAAAAAGCARSIPRDPLVQGPRCVPRGVGPADGAAPRGARRLTGDVKGRTTQMKAIGAANDAFARCPRPTVTRTFIHDDGD